jgi:hypothetical protein
VKGQVQLRDYRIKSGHMEDWIAGWRSGIVPLRQQAGFLIVGAWVDRAHDRFVWLVGYCGTDGFESAEARYHALPDRLSQRPNPSAFVDAATLDMVEDMARYETAASCAVDIDAG